jgi:hypothetical protein
MAFIVVTTDIAKHLIGSKTVHVLPKNATVSAALMDGSVEVRAVTIAGGVLIYRDDGSRSPYLYSSGITKNAV